MVLQSSMGANKLDVRYGDRNTLPYYNGVLDIALLNRSDVATIATAGKVMTLTTARRLTDGVTDQGQIPYYSWSGLDENNYPDVRRDRGMPGYLDKPEDVTQDGVSYEGIGAPGSPQWPGIPNSAEDDPIAGGWATIQHVAAAELSSTAFITDTTALGGGIQVSYAPGTALTACAFQNGAGPTATDDVSSVGQICPVQAATDVVIGYVAPAGVLLGPEGYPHIAFTPAYIAGTTAVVYNAGANTLTSDALAAPIA